MANDSFTKINVGVDLTEGEDILKVRSYLKQMENVIKTLTDEGQAFATALKRSKNMVSQEFYVATSRAAKVMQGFQTVQGKILGEGDMARSRDPFTITSSNAKMYSDVRQLEADRKTIAELRAQIARIGGTMKDVPNSPNTYELSYPSANIRNANGRFGMNSKAYVNQLFSWGAYQAHGQTDPGFVGPPTPPGLGNLPVSSGGGGGGGGILGKDLATGIKGLSILYVIRKLLHDLVDISRKVLEGILRITDNAQKNTQTGWALNLSAAQVQAYERAGQAKGLAAGTVTGAMSDIVKMFSVPSEMNTKNLGNLAKVMGSGVADLVSTGLGGQDPESSMNQIISAYMQRALSGQSVEGINVGTEKAYMSLFNQLSSISPDLAAVFARQWQDRISMDAATRTPATGSTTNWLMNNPAVAEARTYTNADNAQLQDIKTVLDEIKSLWEGIKTGVLADIARLLSGVIMGVRNAMRMGMTAEARVRDIEAARAANAIKLQEAEGVFGEFQGSVDDQVAFLASKAGITDPEKLKAIAGVARNFATTGVMPNFATYGIEELGQAMVRDPALLNNFMRLGTTKASAEAVGNFIAHIEKEQGSNDTGWVMGDAYQEALMAGSDTKFNMDSLMQLSFSGRGAQKALAAYLYNLNKGAEERTLGSSEAKYDEMARQVTSQTVLKALANSAVATYNADRGTGREAKSYGISVSDQTITIVLQDAEGRTLQTVVRDNQTAITEYAAENQPATRRAATETTIVRPSAQNRTNAGGVGPRF